MTGIIRAPRPERGWTDLPNKILRDSRLSYRARGILCRLLSNKDGFRMTSDDLSREAPEGRYAILQALKELRAYGYLVMQKKRVERGRWVTETYVYDEPVTVTSTEVQLPEVGAPNSGRPKVGLPSAIQVDQDNDQQKDQKKEQQSAPRLRKKNNRDNALAKADPLPAGSGGCLASDSPPVDREDWEALERHLCTLQRTAESVGGNPFRDRAAIKKIRAAAARFGATRVLALIGGARLPSEALKDLAPTETEIAALEKRAAQEAGEAQLQALKDASMDKLRLEMHDSGSQAKKPRKASPPQGFPALPCPSRILF